MQIKAKVNEEQLKKKILKETSQLNINIGLKKKLIAKKKRTL